MENTLSKDARALSKETSKKALSIEKPVIATEVCKSNNATIVIVERRAFLRDCITRALISAADINVVAVASIEEWLDLSKSVSAALIVLSAVGGRREEEVKKEMVALSQVANPLPTIVLSDGEEVMQIVHALEQGARGYISTDMPLGVAVEAFRLVKAGGTFAPASGLIASQRRAQSLDRGRHLPNGGMFTGRQAAVIESLRQGKSNKLIAYELNMCESTVKVHVRNIMKRLKAKNRTEVAFIFNQILGQDGR